MKIKGIISLIVFLSFFVGQSQHEKLVVFVQDTSKHFADNDFVKNHYDQLKKYAKDNTLSIELRDVKNGVPPDLLNTPSIHYYDASKHFVFKGRYTEAKRIQNWISTSKLLFSKKDSLNHNNVFYGDINGNVYTFPVKVGVSHGKYWDSRKYAVNKDHREIDSIFQLPFLFQNKSYGFKDNITIPYQSRKYYMDFYPYRTNNKLFISVKVFSEFHCKIPVFETEVPLSSSYRKRAQLIYEAKKLALAEIKKIIESGITGDAHTNFLRKNEPIISERSMGVGLSETNEIKTVFPTDFPNDWSFDSDLYKGGSLRFLIPNSIYTGEIIDFKAELKLDSMKGFATAKLMSLSTGDVGLDYSIIDRILADSFGISKIKFKEVYAQPSTPINDWGTYNYSILCDFTFAGKTIEEEIELTLAPMINVTSGEIELYCYSTFTIYMMRQFGIETGVGETEDKDTVEFYLSFIMKNNK